MLFCNTEKGSWGGDKMAKPVAFFLPVLGLHTVSPPTMLGSSRKPRSHLSHLLPLLHPLYPTCYQAQGSLHLWNLATSLWPTATSLMQGTTWEDYYNKLPTWSASICALPPAIYYLVCSPNYPSKQNSGATSHPPLLLLKPFKCLPLLLKPQL